MTLVKVWGKALGPYTDEIIHDGDLDESQIYNTAQGNGTEGWSIPPPRNDAALRPFYPAQNPYFISYPIDIKPPNSAFSIRAYNPVGYPLGTTVRNETYTRKSELRSNETQWVGFDLYIPDTVGTDPTLRKIIFQTHTLNSPGFTIEEDRNGWLSCRFTRNGGGSEAFYFRFLELTRNTWHHLVFKITYRPNLTGRCTMWVNRNLARFWSFDGSTYTKGLVPSGTGIYEMDASRGTLPLTTVDDGNPVTLFDFNGYTLKTDTAAGGLVSNISQKAGWYQSSLSTYIYDVPTLISRWESGDFNAFTGLEKAERVSLVNYDDPVGSKFLNPNVREPVIYFNARFSIIGAGQTDEDLFREVHFDGLSPLEAPSDFVWNSVEPTTYNLTLSSSNPTFGTVSRNVNNPVTAGATVQLTATPVGTGVFNGWYLDSVSFANLITTDNPYSIVVNSGATIIGHFIDGTPIPPEQPRKKWAKKRNEVV